MNIIIAGGGRVGYHLAKLLAIEHHDLTVIEKDPERLELIDQAVDASTINGNVISVVMLKESGVENADLFVSVTGRDEVNLLAAAAAKGLGAKQVVARVDEEAYIESSILYEAVLGIDYVLSPEALTALDIAKYIETSGIAALQDFGRGRVQMRQVRVSKSPTVGGKTLKDVVPPGSGVLLGVISRGSEIVIPHGDSIVEPGDMVTLVGKTEALEAMQKRFQGKESHIQRVVIMGGGSMGFLLARALDRRRRSIKIFERNPLRCEELANGLEHVEIICADGSSRETLERELAGEADVFVSVTDDDERNIMASVLAREVGAERTVAVVHQPDFASLVPKLGIDHAVTPRACLANRVLRMVHSGAVTSLAVLEEGRVEVVELSAKDKSPILNRPLKDLRNKFPKNALVAAILRGDQVIVPSGADAIRPGDSVVLIVDSESLESVQKLFPQ